MAKEPYDDLIFELGDLAREHLADHPRAPRSMQTVFDIEDAVLARRAEITELEEALNAEEASWNDFLDSQEAEKADQEAIVKKWRAAVAGVEKRSRDMRKKAASLKAAHRYQRASVKRAEEKHKDLELREGHDPQKIAVSKENLKKLRLTLMREARNLEELDFDLKQVLTPRPGQPGAQGILAHKRLLELEDELEERTAQHDDTMKRLDAEIAAKDEEVKLAEDDLDSAIFALGEEVYTDRFAHPKLNPHYARLDKAG